MQKFINNGLQLEYQVTGNGIPFVFLHGMGGSVKQIEDVYEPIEGVQLITLNQQGHGDSETDVSSLDFTRLGDDVIALLNHLSIEKAYFAGISMGAAVSLNIAVRYSKRVEQLLLIRNAWTDKPMSQEVQKDYYDCGVCLQTGGIEAFYQTEGWKMVSKQSAYTRNAFISVFSDSSCVKNWQKYVILPQIAPITSVEELKALTLPMTILANRNDWCHPFSYGEYIHNHNKASKFIEIPDKDSDSKGHKNEINKAIKNMLQHSNY